MKENNALTTEQTRPLGTIEADLRRPYWDGRRNALLGESRRGSIAFGCGRLSVEGNRDELPKLLKSGKSRNEHLLKQWLRAIGVPEDIDSPW